MICPRNLRSSRYVILLLLMFGIILVALMVHHSGKSKSQSQRATRQSISVEHMSDYIQQYVGKDEQSDSSRVSITRQTDSKPVINEYNNQDAALRNIMDQINKRVTQDKDLEQRLGKHDSCYEYRRSAMKRRPVAYDVLRHIRAPLLTNDSITLISHMTYSKMHPLVQVIQNWDGPISVAMYISKSLIPEMLNTFEKMDHIRNSTILLHIVPKEEDLYPVNYMRNIALNASTTHYVFLMDIDFVPMPRAHQILMKYVQPNRQQVLVVPAFEEIQQNSMDIFPQNKSELLKMWKKKTIGPFHKSKHFGMSHRLTNFDGWKRQATAYNINAARNDGFEPYIVGERSELPPYSELFAGRGYNKIQHIMEVKAMKFEFAVCPEVFSIHLWHEKPLSKEIGCSKKSRQVFLRYLKEKYGFGPGYIPEFIYGLYETYQVISMMLTGD